MSKRKIWTDRLGNEYDVTNIDEFQQEGGTMSKTGAWALDHEEKERELPTFTVVQASRVISTWIIQCQDEDTAIEIASTSEPDNEEVDQQYEFEINRGV